MLRHLTSWVKMAALVGAALLAFSTTPALAQRGRGGGGGRGGVHVGSFRGGHVGGYRGGYVGGYRGGVYRGPYGHVGYGYRGYHYRPYWGVGVLGLYGLGGYGYGYPYSSYGYAYPYATYNNYSVAPPVITTPGIDYPVITSSGYAPSTEAVAPSAYAAPADNAARLQVTVPAGAEVWVDGEQTTQTGTSRTFVSPPLTPGRDFVYTVRARWMTDSGPKEEAREVRVRANQTSQVDFTAPAPAEQVPAVPPNP
jgi:uncharacterized protein (TIGR03000 family)